MSTRERLFVFGTLRDADVLELVLGRRRDAVAARTAQLPGHATVTLPGETYPVLAPAPRAAAPGLVLDLGREDMRRVAFFEGDEYAFERATVVAGGGERVDVVLCAERATRPGARGAWTLERWQREHKAQFLALAAPYMALYGRLDTQEADRVWQRMSGRG